ncbi:MAG: RAMP superfamily CRISPR-associated protein [Candidatus Bathyarchaeia archaeon]
MICYRVCGTLVAKTPLHIGSGKRAGVIKHTTPYIPGSFLRGAFGISLLKVACKLDEPLVNHEKCKYLDDCLYTYLYGDDFSKSANILFRYAYPLHIKCGGVYLPAKRTVFRCENRQCGMTYDTFKPPLECVKCGKKVKPYTGYVCSGCGEMEPHPTPVTRIISTAIDRGRFSAATVGGREEKGTLRTLEVIDRGAEFRLEVILFEECREYLEKIKSLLARGLTDEGVGGEKSSGLGKVTVENLTITEVTSEDIRRRAREIDPADFTVWLVSPMVLREGESTIDASALLENARRAYTRCFKDGKPSLPEVTIAEQQLVYGTFSGWSLRDERRRRVEPMLAAGSTLRFQSDSRDEKLALGLAALEVNAVGAYKPHGCGQIKIG